MALGSEAVDFFEREPGPGSDHEVVVGNGRVVVQLKPIFIGMEAAHTLAVELDAVLLHELGQVDLDLVFFTPADGNPGVRGCELEVIGVPDEHEVVLLAELLPEFVNL